jgi:hypothetical protein
MLEVIPRGLNPEADLVVFVDDLPVEATWNSGIRGSFVGRFSDCRAEGSVTVDGNGCLLFSLVMRKRMPPDGVMCSTTIAKRAEAECSKCTP